MSQESLTYEAKVAKAAIDIYEYYERDYTDFTNSRLRAIKYCDLRIANNNEKETKLFWLDVKTELQNSKL